MERGFRRGGKSWTGAGMRTVWAQTAGIATLGAVLVMAAPLHAQGATPQLRAAEALLQQGQLARAEAELLAEVKEHPSSVEAWNLLGIVQTEQQEFEGALASFRKALRIAPGSAKTHNNLGNLYLVEKKPALAEREFRSSLRLDPQNRDANYNLGALLLQRGAAAEAVRCFERVRPADTGTRVALIQANLAAGHKADALRLTDALSLSEPNSFKLHFSLGVLMGSVQEYRRSELEFEKADALEPHRFEVLYDLGEACLLNGDFAKAEEQVKRALALKPDSAQALYLLGQAEWKQARPLDALEVLVRAHAAEPKDADITLLMAQISMAQGYYADAIPLLEAGVQSAPERMDLLGALGESYFRADRLSKAREAFEKVVVQAPSARAWSFLGLSDLYLGRYDAAKQDFQSGLALDPHDSFCLFNLGYIAERQGDTAGAAATFEKVLRADPNFSNALLELAGIRIGNNQYAEAEPLLKRYVAVSRDPGPGYYKLAMVERRLNKPAEAQQDLAEFQRSSRSAPVSYRYEDLFDYLDNRSKLSAGGRKLEDLAELQGEVKKHPDQPEILYLLAQAQLQAGDAEDARSTIAHLDAVKAGDDRTLAGAGVLLARYRLYDDAIGQFRMALKANPKVDEVRFDLANALFHKGQYAEALEAAQQVTGQEAQDDAYLALLADIEAHLGQAESAEATYRSAIARGPDNEQNYLALALLQMRENRAAEAKKTLLSGQARVPASGKILWGLGLAAVMNGDAGTAAGDFEKAVDLLPEWPGSYSMLGIFYYQTGQVAKAREVLERFKGSHSGGLDVSRIEQVLESTAQPQAAGDSLSVEKRAQLLQMAELLVDRTM